MMKSSIAHQPNFGGGGGGGMGTKMTFYLDFKSTVNQSSAINRGWWCSKDRLLTNTASNSLQVILFNILLGTVLNRLTDIQMFQHSQYRKTQTKMSVIYCSSRSHQNSIVCFAPK